MRPAHRIRHLFTNQPVAGEPCAPDGEDTARTRIEETYERERYTARGNSTDPRASLRAGEGQVSFQEFAREDAIITDMSADGSAVVGLYDSPTTTSAFRWSASGTELIGVPGMFTQVRISRDGKTIVGTVPGPGGCATAAIWQGGMSWKMLDPFPGVVPSEQNTCTTASAVSGDGTVIVGGAYVSRTKVVMFRWDAQNGMVNLGTFDEGTNSDSYPYAVSADGKTVVGWDYKQASVRRDRQGLQ